MDSTLAQILERMFQMANDLLAANRKIAELTVELEHARQPTNGRVVEASTDHKHGDRSVAKGE